MSSKNTKQKKVIFLTGFLGSGKTTMLNHILSQFKDKTIGVIVNEIGEVNIDSEIINLKKGEIARISGGSIFCSCLSASFVKSILSYQDLDIDYIFVESSGLSRPASVVSIMEEVNKISNNAFLYQGMLCAIDAKNYLTMVESVVALQEQLIYSNLIVINKSDLVNKEVIEKIKKDLKKRNSDADIIVTSFGKIDKKVLEKNYTIDRCNCKCSPNDCSSEENNENFLLVVEGAISHDKFMTFIKKISNYTYRIKGFVLFQDGPIHLSCVGEEISISNINKEIQRTELVFIAAETVKIEEKIEVFWDIPSDYILR